MKKLLFYSMLISSILFAGCDEIIPEPNPGDDPIDTTSVRPIVDTIPPKIVSTNPAANAVGVPESTTVEVVFSKPIKPMTATTVTLLAGESVVPVTISIKGDKITLSSGLKKGTIYTVVIPGTVSDPVGNRLGTEFRLSFTTEAEVEPIFTIPGVSMCNLAADPNGNIYVAGSYGAGDADCFIARFNPQGELVWRYNVSTPLVDFIKGDIIFSDGVIYVGVVTDWTGTDAGNGWLYAISEIGDVKWKAAVNATGGIVVTEDNIFVTNCLQAIKLNKDGNVLKTISVPGTALFGDVTIANGEIFITGCDFTGEAVASRVWKLDSEMNLIYEKQGTAISAQSAGQSIIAFPEKSLFFVGESYGDIASGIASKSIVYCYQISVDGLSLVWEKTFDGSLHINLFRSGDNLYVFSEFSTKKMTINGDILWSGDAHGMIAVTTDGKIFVANKTDALYVYQ